MPSHTQIDALIQRGYGHAHCDGELRLLGLGHLLVESPHDKERHYPLAQLVHLPRRQPSRKV